MSFSYLFIYLFLKTLGKAKVSFEELQIVLVEIEAVVNHRSLMYVGSEDEREPLAPSHLVLWETNANNTI